MSRRLRLARGLAVLSVAALGLASAGVRASTTPLAPGLAEALSALGRTATMAEAQTAVTALKDRYGLTGAALGAGLASDPALAVQMPAFVPSGAAVVEMVDMRLLLAQIAVQTGAKDHLALVRAQDEGVHQVILLRGGLVTLPELVALVAKSAAAGFMTTGPDGVTLTRAIIVWPDAGLTLGAADTLNLSRADGSFMANLGWLDIHGATLRGTEAPNLREPAFRPFLLTAGRGSLTMTDASLAHLGFGETQRFGGVSVDTSGLKPPLMPPVVQTSRFEDVAMLALISTAHARVTGNRVQDGAILIAQSSGARVTGNLVTRALGQAIRISGGSTDAVVADNIILGGLAGLSVDQASLRVTLSGNLLAGQSTSAIRLDKVDCVQVAGNLAALGMGTGVSLSNTGRVALSGNAILENTGAGILLRDQRIKASVRITGNQIAGNHEGLRGATAGAIQMAGNDLEGQLPRLFAGDLAPRTIGWLEDRRALGKPQALQSDLAPVCPDEGNI